MSSSVNAYISIFSRLAHPGFLDATEVFSGLAPRSSLTHNKFATFVTDLCILNGTPTQPRLYIGKVEKYEVILCDGHGYPLLRVKYNGSSEEYSIESLRNFSFKQRGNDRNIMRSAKPQYLIKQLKMHAAKFANPPMFNAMLKVQTETYHAVQHAVGAIAQRGRTTSTYVTDAALLFEMTQIIRGELPLESASSAVRSIADTYYIGTKKIVEDRANVSNLFAANFPGKTFYAIAVFGDYGFGVTTIGIKPGVTMSSLQNTTHTHVDILGGYRMFKSLAKFKELAPALYDEVYLQLAMNKNALMGMDSHAPNSTTAISFADGFVSGGDRTLLSLVPTRDFYNETLNAFGWWDGGINYGNPSLYFMEKVS